MIEFSFAYSKKAQDEQWIATGKRGPQRGTVAVDETALTPDQRRIIAPFIAPVQDAFGRHSSTTPIITLATYHLNDTYPAQPHVTPTLMDFDTVPEVDRILALLPDIHSQEAEVSAAAKKTKEEWDQRQREDTARNAEQAKQRIENARLAKEAEQRQKQQDADERKAWIDQHGSAHLKKCIEKDYNCTRLYWIERAALEYPGAILDYNDAAAWKERSGPSMAALTKLEALEKQYPQDKVVIVWLTAEPSNQPDEEVDNRDEREAIALKPAAYGGLWLVYEV